MKNSSKPSSTIFCVTSLLSFLMIGCAGGTPVQLPEPAPVTTPTPLDISVAISTPSVGMQRSGTWNFAATVLNSANTAVTWGIQENSAGGTASSVSSEVTETIGPSPPSTHLAGPPHS